MRIARFNKGRIGLVEGEEIVDITDPAGVDVEAWPPTGMVSLLGRMGAMPERISLLGENAPRLLLSDVRLDCPIDWPNKVIAYPANYQAHIEEQKVSDVGLISEFAANSQGFFLKSNSSLSGPADPIMLPPVPHREIHHECEMAVIIGKRGRGISRDRAMEYVFGYSCLVDVVIRGREERVMRKSYDSFCPLGPWIVTPEGLDPFNLNLKLTVNGEVRQQANTRDMILDIPAMIEMASAVMTLYPGDVIASGTPAGVGPITDGDRLVSEVEGLGCLDLAVRKHDVGMHVVWTKPAA